MSTNTRSQRKKRSQTVSRTRNTISNVIPSVPPTYDTAISIRHKFRFIATATGSSTITSANIMGLLFVYPSLSSTLYSILSAFRVRKVSMWAPTGTVGDMDIEFQNTTSGAIGAKPVNLSSASFSTSQPNKIMKRPTPDSASATWQNVISNNTVTTGISLQLKYFDDTIIDLDLDIVLQNADPSFLTTVFGSPGLVAGKLYLNALDTNTAILRPVGYQSPF